MSFLIPVIAGIVVFAGLFLVLGPKLLDREGALRTKNLVKTLQQADAAAAAAIQARDVHVFKGRESEGLLPSLMMKIPYYKDVPGLIAKSGNVTSPGMYLIYSVMVLVIFLMVFRYVEFEIYGVFLAIFLMVWIPRKILLYLVEKRTENFIESFPDALDMIVRSVKSGHPLNSALKMIAENMTPPISTEFKQIVDEISYGRSVTEALYRLSDRIDQTDISFFVVVLAVQQETGGNLAEVLSNLSNIIRKRKQLRLKIKALTSEGRMTAWILGSLPGILLIVLSILAPDYLDPLFHTKTGKTVLGIAFGMVGCSLFVIRKLIRIEI